MEKLRYIDLQGNIEKTSASTEFDEYEPRWDKRCGG